MTLAERMKQVKGQNNGLDIIMNNIPVENIKDLPVEKLHPFPGHTFQVRKESEHYKALLGSVRENGVKVPLLVRPARIVGDYEIIAGHTRHTAAMDAGLEKVPCIVRAMTDDEATRMMVESNIQRPDWLPSEKARSFKAWLEAVRRESGIRAGRPTENSGTKFPNYEEVARNRDFASKKWGMSGKMFDMYIKLNDLTPEMLALTDEGRIVVKAAYQLSFLSPADQQLIADFLKKYPRKKIPEAKGKELREAAEMGDLDSDYLEQFFGVVEEKRKERKINITIISEDITNPATIRAALDDPDVLIEIEELIIKWAKKNKLPLV